MAKINKSRTVQCDNDCEPLGCPSHEVGVEYMSSSNSVTLRTFNGTLTMDLNTTQAVYDMLKEIAEYRKDFISA